MAEVLSPGEGVAEAVEASMTPIGQSLNFTTFEPAILEAAGGSAASGVTAAIFSIVSSISAGIGAIFSGPSPE